MKPIKEIINNIDGFNQSGDQKDFEEFMKFPDNEIPINEVSFNIFQNQQKGYNK